MMYNRNTRPRIFCIVYITLGKKPNSLSSYEAQVSEMHKRFKHADARIFSKDFLCFFFFMYVMLTSSMSLILNHIHMHVHNACEYVRNFENFSYTSVSHSLRANEADELGSACTHIGYRNTVPIHLPLLRCDLRSVQVCVSWVPSVPKGRRLWRPVEQLKWP